MCDYRTFFFRIILVIIFAAMVTMMTKQKEWKT